MILIDCPPTLGLLTVNALVAADRALLSTEAEYFSLQGVEQAMEVVELARDSLNPELELLGVVPQHRQHAHPPRPPDAGGAARALRRQLFGTVIRRSIAYAESAERAIPILDYRPDRGVDYLRLAARSSRALGEQAEDLLERARPSCQRRGRSRTPRPRRAG